MRPINCTSRTVPAALAVASKQRVILPCASGPRLRHSLQAVVGLRRITREARGLLLHGSISAASRIKARPAKWGPLASLKVMGPRREGVSEREDREGAGIRRSIACSVNRFVNRTRRDSLRRGRRSRRSETGSVLSAEVTAPVRDGLRRERPMSYGS